MKGPLSAAILVVGLAQFAPLSFAQDACKGVEFSPEVLQRLPRIREACLKVIKHGGQEYAVIKAELLQVSRNSVTVRPIMPGGSVAEPRTIKIDPGFRVRVDGQPMRVQELELGQDLTAYVKVHEPMIALEPADTSQTLALSPITAAPAPVPVAAAPVQQVASVPVLPKTASSAPWLLVGGATLLLLATALRARFLWNARS